MYCHSWFPLVRFSTFCAFLVAAFSLLTSCSGYSATGGPGRLVPKALSTEVLAEYEFSSIRDVVILPIEGEPLRYQSLQLAAELQKSLLESLALETDLEVRNLSEAAAVAAAIESLDAATVRGKAQQLNQLLSPDAVLYVIVSRFKETPKGEMEPASVSFRAWLLPEDTSSPVWTATYEFTEKPISENLFRMKQALKGGVAYKGGQTLLENGFRDLARAFESLRLSSAQGR